MKKERFGSPVYRGYYAITINGEEGWLKLSVISDIDTRNALSLCFDALKLHYPDITDLQCSIGEEPAKDELKFTANGTVTYSTKTLALDIHSMCNTDEPIKQIKFLLK